MAVHGRQNKSNSSFALPIFSQPKDFTHYLQKKRHPRLALILILNDMSQIHHSTNITRVLQACLVAWAMAASAAAQTGNSFLVHNLVSDLPNIADHQDANLKNPWGNGFGNQPFWIANNGTGTSTLYSGYGVKIALTVTIPAANGATTPAPVPGVPPNIFR